VGCHTGSVRGVAALPDGRVVTSGDDHRVRFWDPTKRAQRAEIQLSSEAISAAESGPGIAMISVAQYGGLSVWST